MISICISRLISLTAINPPSTHHSQEMGNEDILQVKGFRNGQISQEVIKYCIESLSRSKHYTCQPIAPFAHVFQTSTASTHAREPCHHPYQSSSCSHPIVIAPIITTAAIPLVRVRVLPAEVLFHVLLLAETKLAWTPPRGRVRGTPLPAATPAATREGIAEQAGQSVLERPG